MVIQTTISRTRTPTELSISFLHKVGEFDSRGAVPLTMMVREIESDGERNRGLYILKSRGMAHSNQVREFRLTDQGIKLIDVYLGTEGMLVGTAREARMIRAEAEARERAYEAQQRQRRTVTK